MPGFPVLHCFLEFAQNSYPLSQRCYPTISPSVSLFSSCPQSFPVSGSFPMSRLFTSGGQSIAEIYLPLNLAKYAFSQHTCFFLCCLLRRKNICWKHPWWRLSVWKGFQLMLWRETREIELLKLGCKTLVSILNDRSSGAIPEMRNDGMTPNKLLCWGAVSHGDIVIWRGPAGCLKHLGREGSGPPLKHWLDSWCWIQSFRIISLSEMEVIQSCLTLSGPLDYTVHGILQARILEWVAFTFSWGSSQPRDRTEVSHIAGRFFSSWPTREAQQYWSGQPIPSLANLPGPGIESGHSVRSDSLQLHGL